MEELLLMTGLFAAGAGVGAVCSYARDRNLLHLYSNLVQDLSSMVHRDQPAPPDGPADSAGIPQYPSLTDAVQRKRAS
jgi:hypothetical protein